MAEEKSFAVLLPEIENGLKRAGARIVATETIPAAGHYVVDEKPAEIATLMNDMPLRPNLWVIDNKRLVWGFVFPKS